MSGPKVIPFWRVSDEFGCFAQWYKSNFTIDGITYCCAEQYMMSKKALLFGDNETNDQIMRSKDARNIKHLGRQVSNFDQEKWSENCEEIVYQGNLAKFTQNENIKNKLLSTGDAIIVEASPLDSIWGIGISAENLLTPDGELKIPVEQWQGSNLLGKALMRVRDTIKTHE